MQLSPKAAHERANREWTINPHPSGLLISLVVQMIVALAATTSSPGD